VVGSNETSATSLLRRTRRKLATANRRLERIREERRRSANMRPVYRLLNLIGGVAVEHFEKKDGRS
jgi:hypothetical protein